MLKKLPENGKGYTMKTIKVNASKTYDILLGNGIIDKIGTYLKEIIVCKKIVIVTDTNVNKLYGENVATKLKESGFEVFIYEFLAGEKSKNSATYLELIAFIAKNHLQRSDCLLALGGGVVGDITGFAAATYMRGIKYIQVPTTLLSIIDSSVGGKTGIDLPEGKNLLGAFYQPDRVIADTKLLTTLPYEEVKNGKGELIKYGILLGGELWELIEQCEDPLKSEKMLSLCINYKRDIVEADEHENSVRKLLNLGHTAGHAIEKLTNYVLPHGECVALGIAIIIRASLKRGDLSLTSYNKIMSVLVAENMPITTEIDEKTIIDAALNDKKRQGNELTMVVVKDIGKCVMENVPIEKLGEYFICR
ncbi:MAG TPA: 3-dehydroquinate synthase [Clostridia bacterium]|nr:3-dehydroquinate synthase [Clostridia bacterium]